MRQERDLTKGAIVKSLWLFALPLMLGNVLQQLYNLVDTWVVGRYLGKRALAAVGASYTLMTFLTSVVIGLCLGAGAFFAMAYGRREKETFRNGIFMSLYGNWRSFDSFDNTVVWLRKTAYLSFAGAGGNGRGYGNVSHICICRILCYFFV